MQYGCMSLHEQYKQFMDSQLSYSGVCQIAITNVQNMTGVSTTSLTPVKLFEITLHQTVTNLISYAYGSANPAGGTNVGFQLYRNGSPLGSAVVSNTASFYCSFPTQTFNNGDTWEVWGYCVAGGVTAILNSCINYKMVAIPPTRSNFWFDAYINGVT